MKYREIISLLASAGVEDPGFEAGVLISHFCGISAAALPLMREESFENAELSAAVSGAAAVIRFSILSGPGTFAPRSTVCRPTA